METHAITNLSDLAVQLAGLNGPGRRLELVLNTLDGIPFGLMTGERVQVGSGGNGLTIELGSGSLIVEHERFKDAWTDRLGDLVIRFHDGLSARITVAA